MLRTSMLMAAAVRNIYTSNFSAGVDGVTTTRATAAGNIDGVAGVDDCLRLTVDGSLGTHILKQSGITTEVGKRFNMSLDYYIPAGQSNVDGLQINNGVGSFRYAGPFGVVGSWVLGESFNFVSNNVFGFRIYPTDGEATTFQDAGADDVIYVKNIKIDLLS